MLLLRLSQKKKLRKQQWYRSWSCNHNYFVYWWHPPSKTRCDGSGAEGSEAGCSWLCRVSTPGASTSRACFPCHMPRVSPARSSIQFSSVSVVSDTLIYEHRCTEPQQPLWSVVVNSLYKANAENQRWALLMLLVQLHTCHSSNVSQHRCTEADKHLYVSWLKRVSLLTQKLSGQVQMKAATRRFLVQLIKVTGSNSGVNYQLSHTQTVADSDNKASKDSSSFNFWMTPWVIRLIHILF